MYSSFKLDYIEARDIIFAHINEYDTADRRTLLMFDANAKSIDKSIITLQEKLADNNINEADITLILSELVEFANSISILLSL